MSRASDLFLPVRLPPGADLRRALESLVLPPGWGGAFVLSGIGSLRDPRIRLADAETERTWQGSFEILGLAGSISRDGAHLHISVADARGAVVGGHLAHGSVVRTTAELLLAGLDEWDLQRRHDPATGYAELSVARRTR